MLLTLCLLLPLLQDTAQDPAAEAAPQAHTEPYFSLQYTGLDSFLVDPKDAGLRKALGMADDRLLEVLREFGQDDLPPGTIELVAGLLSGPVALTLDMADEPIPGLPVPVVAELLVSRDSEAAAQTLTGDLVTWLEGLGMPLEQPAPGETCALPAPVPLWMGTDGREFFIRFGRESTTLAPSLDDLVPAGSNLSFAGRMDYGSFLSLVMEMEGVAGAQGDEMMALFDQIGLSDMAYEWAIATDDQRQLMVFNMPGWGKTARELGLLAEKNLDEEFLRCIPADATWASCFSFDLRGVLEYYQGLMDMATDGEMDLIAVIEEAVDINVEEELLAPFGSRGAIYASDTTGGGGAMSMVLVLELADRDAFVKTLARAKEAVNGPLADMASGYVRFSDWNGPGIHFGSLIFPGMPIPFELTVIAGGSHAVIALTPQAALAAISQVVEPGSSLLDNPAFREQLSGPVDGCTAIQFVDTPRLLRDGYGTVALVCAALTNAVRSPSDAQRDPGLILPGYAELGHDAKAIVGTVRVVGDDFRTEYRADRSQLVNATGIVGMLFNGPALPLVALGLTGTLAMPRVAHSMEDAYEGKAMADIEEIHAALRQYNVLNGRYPDSLEELVIPDANGARFLETENGIIDPWGVPYGYRPPTDDDPSPQVWCESLGGF